MCDGTALCLYAALERLMKISLAFFSIYALYYTCTFCMSCDFDAKYDEIGLCICTGLKRLMKTSAELRREMVTEE